VRLCFVFLGRATNPPAKSPFLEGQFLSPSQASLSRPVRLGRPCQEKKVPASIARKVIEACKPPPPPQQGADNRGKPLVRSRIEIEGSILEQVKQFNYFRCELSLDGEPDFDKKINRFQGILENRKSNFLTFILWWSISVWLLNFINLTKNCNVKYHN